MEKKLVSVGPPGELSHNVALEIVAPSRSDLVPESVVDFHGKSRLAHARRSNNGHDSQALVRLLPGCEPPEELFHRVVGANKREGTRLGVGQLGWCKAMVDVGTSLKKKLIPAGMFAAIVKPCYVNRKRI